MTRGFYWLVACSSVPRPAVDQALFRATVLQNKSEIRRLLDAKTSVNCTEDDGDTPLHVAAGSARLDLVQLLLASKASMTIADRGGHLPEDDALDEGHEAIYNFLREARGERPGGSLRAETELDRLHLDVTRQHGSLRNHVALQVGTRICCRCQLVYDLGAEASSGGISHVDSLRFVAVVVVPISVVIGGATSRCPNDATGISACCT